MLLEITKLHKMLGSISNNYTITHIDVYGGDLATLSKEYLTSLIDCVNEFCDSITVISDPSKSIVELKNKFNFNIATSINAERPYSADTEHSDMLIYTVLPSMLSIDAKYFLSYQKKDIRFN